MLPAPAPRCRGCGCRRRWLPGIAFVKVTLIHNPGAGNGQDVKALVGLIEAAGHDLRFQSSKKDWKKLLKEPTDLVVAAGGDGTVGRVALEAAKRKLPFAAIPIGTAN